MEKERSVEVMEDGVMKLEFTIEDGYLINIAINLKSNEDIPRLAVDDRIAISRWLTNLKSGILQSVSGQPAETVDLSIPERVITEEELDPLKICRKCGGELVLKKGCCGNTHEVLRCKQCGRNHKLVKGEIRGRIAPEPPLIMRKPTKHVVEDR